jgi:hypothetical protein
MKAFAIGSVIVPARDGMLARLGHDVGTLGTKALGVVIEDRPGKALVQFPDLRIALWIDKEEMADVEARSREGDVAFTALIPDFENVTGPSIPLVWWVWLVARSLPVTHVLGIESGPLASLWNDEDIPLANYTDVDLATSAHALSLGISELVLKDWHDVERRLAGPLLFARFLPAGMHKLELALYLRA